MYKSHMIDKNDLDPIVQALVAARKRQGMTLSQTAEAAGLSRRALGMIESGGDCTLSSLRRIFTALGMEFTARPLRRPTLEDLDQENDEALFGDRNQERPGR